MVLPVTNIDMPWLCGLFPKQLEGSQNILQKKPAVIISAPVRNPQLAATWGTVGRQRGHPRLQDHTLQHLLQVSTVDIGYKDIIISGKPLINLNSINFNFPMPQQSQYTTDRL